MWFKFNGAENVEATLTSKNSNPRKKTEKTRDYGELAIWIFCTVHANNIVKFYASHTV